MKKFEEWLKKVYKKKNGESPSMRTVNKYVSAVDIISKEMEEIGVITKPLITMTLGELDCAIQIIFSNQIFIEKDERGHKMYSNGIKKYRCCKYYNWDSYIDEVKENSQIFNNKTLDITEKETLILSRRGQGKFKRLLMEKYGERCIVTNLSVPQILIASHIKPWSVCNNYERLDVNNGLLLSATYDKLFDSGLITFDNSGKIKISSMIKEYDRHLLSLNKTVKLDIKINNDMKKYLAYHYEYIFIR